MGVGDGETEDAGRKIGVRILVELPGDLEP